MGDYEEYKKDEMRADAQDYAKNALEEEFNQSVTKQEIVKDIIANITKEELIELLIDCEVEDTSLYQEFKEEMFNEYMELRD